MRLYVAAVAAERTPHQLCGDVCVAVCSQRKSQINIICQRVYCWPVASTILRTNIIIRPRLTGVRALNLQARKTTYTCVVCTRTYASIHRINDEPPIPHTTHEEHTNTYSIQYNARITPQDQHIQANVAAHKHVMCLTHVNGSDMRWKDVGGRFVGV